MAPKTKKPAEEKKPLEGNFVDKKEFDSFRKETSETQNQILGILEKISSTTNSKGESSKSEERRQAIQAGPETSGYLPQQYQTVFEKYFDPNDGFTARLTFPETDEKGRENGGINFTIVVPMKFSNTDDGYRKMYKADLRTRALMPHNIAKGIEEWCQKVAQNLRYNKNLKTK